MRRGLLTFVIVAALAAGAAAVARSGQSTSESPAVIAAVAPVTYPAIARSTRAGGEVVVEVHLDAEGSVLSAKVISGHPLLKRVSEEAANQWKFSSVAAGTKQRAVRLTFAYREVDKGPNPRSEFTTIFLPPYKVEVQAHPKTID